MSNIPDVNEKLFGTDSPLFVVTYGVNSNIQFIVKRLQCRTVVCDVLIALQSECFILLCSSGCITIQVVL